MLSEQTAQWVRFTEKKSKNYKLVMMERQDYEIIYYLDIPKYESTKGTTTLEQESQLQRVNSEASCLEEKEMESLQHISNDRENQSKLLNSVLELDFQDTSLSTSPEVSVTKEYVNMMSYESLDKYQRNVPVGKAAIKKWNENLRTCQIQINEYAHSDEELEEMISGAVACSDSDYKQYTSAESI